MSARQLNRLAKAKGLDPLLGGGLNVESEESDGLEDSTEEHGENFGRGAVVSVSVSKGPKDLGQRAADCLHASRTSSLTGFSITCFFCACSLPPVALATVERSLVKCLPFGSGKRRQGEEPHFNLEVREGRKY